MKNTESLSFNAREVIFVLGKHTFEYNFAVNLFTLTTSCCHTSWCLSASNEAYCWQCKQKFPLQTWAEASQAIVRHANVWHLQEKYYDFLPRLQACLVPPLFDDFTIALLQARFSLKYRKEAQNHFKKLQSLGL